MATISDKSKKEIIELHPVVLEVIKKAKNIEDAHMDLWALKNDVARAMEILGE